MRGLGRLEGDFGWYNPAERVLVVPRGAGGHREALVLDAHPTDVRRAVERGAATLSDVAREIEAHRTVPEGVELRGGRVVPIDPADPVPAALDLAAALEGNPCWVRGVNLHTTFLSRCRHVIEDFSELGYLSPTLVGDGPGCVLLDEREFSNPGRLLFWRGHFLNEGGEHGVPTSEVARFALSKREEFVDQALDLIQEQLAYPCDTFVVRLCHAEPDGDPQTIGDYLIDGIGDVSTALMFAVGPKERSITRCEDSPEAGTVIAYDDGSVARVRMARESDVSPSMLVPTTHQWIRRCVDPSLFDSRSQPTYAGRDFHRAYETPDDGARDECGDFAPPAPGGTPSKLRGYLAECLGAFTKGHDRETKLPLDALSAFCDFVASDRCPVAPPTPDELRVRTPDGDLVATALDEGGYRSIVIDLERPDGCSGQVCMAEWVSEAERGSGIAFEPGGDGSFGLRHDTEPIYPTAFHTFAFDGRSEDPAASVDLDPSGAEMCYAPRGSAVEKPSPNPSLSEVPTPRPPDSDLGDGSRARGYER